MMDISPIIRTIADEIASQFAPDKIILFSHKVNLEGQVTSFKLAIIIGTEDKCTLEHEMYVTIDSEIPYDLVLYTPAEWMGLLAHENSFADKINRTGVVLYG